MACVSYDNDNAICGPLPLQSKGFELCGDRWRKFFVDQDIIYADKQLVYEIEHKLKQKPALISKQFLEDCQDDLLKLQQKNTLILQIGDCAEHIQDKESADRYLKSWQVFIDTLSNLLLKYSSRDYILRFARIAGQLAKPRSKLYEEDTGLLSYRGDLINSTQPEHIARKPDANRMLLAYDYTKNLLVKLNELNINNADFLKTYSKIYPSHEALHLVYEAALLRAYAGGAFYASSAPFLWVGKRTNNVNNAHIEFCSAIVNPVAVKIDIETSPAGIIALFEKLNPENILGKLFFISRMGAKNIDSYLPNLMKILKKNNKKALWICDPMHGNSYYLGPYKTRKYSDILSEAQSFFAIHKDLGCYAGGLHLESSYENVTEVVDDINIKTEDDLAVNYKTACDPRLNFNQTVKFIEEICHVI